MLHVPVFSTCVERAAAVAQQHKHVTRAHNMRARYATDQGDQSVRMRVSASVYVRVRVSVRCTMYGCVGVRRRVRAWNYGNSAGDSEAKGCTRSKAKAM